MLSALNALNSFNTMHTANNHNSHNNHNHNNHNHNNNNNNNTSQASTFLSCASPDVDGAATKHKAPFSSFTLSPNPITKNGTRNAYSSAFAEIMDSHSRVSPKDFKDIKEFKAALLSSDEKGASPRQLSKSQDRESNRHSMAQRRSLDFSNVQLSPSKGAVGGQGMPIGILPVLGGDRLLPIHPLRDEGKDSDEMSMGGLSSLTMNTSGSLRSRDSGRGGSVKREEEDFDGEDFDGPRDPRGRDCDRGRDRDRDGDRDGGRDGGRDHDPQGPPPSSVNKEEDVKGHHRQPRRSSILHSQASMDALAQSPVGVRLGIMRPEDIIDSPAVKQATDAAVAAAMKANAEMIARGRASAAAAAAAAAASHQANHRYLGGLNGKYDHQNHQNTTTAMPLVSHMAYVPSRRAGRRESTNARPPKITPDAAARNLLYDGPIATENNGATKCKCKRSKCLKLYCECFKAQGFCGGDCSCSCCQNKAGHEDQILEAREGILARNPLAFMDKITEASSQDGLGKVGLHTRGCNCKKSRCEKKYCECFQAGVLCTDHCKCTGCLNCVKAGAAVKRGAGVKAAKHGVDGVDGVDGMDGVDGVDGTDGVDGVDGTDGVDGVDGTDGVDGMLVVPSKTTGRKRRKSHSSRDDPSLPPAVPNSAAIAGLTPVVPTLQVDEF